ncbi:DUF721 domain-containing protein [Candidatus Regiella endosymbiont of Tuberolachnus salignus]|uniref:DUF721 domain-containing protein n=1 Tax=Candidatus Regiella endosymbiont of Tuberolachnus salignus TaxID=3077956 RepID=UPI0030D5507E
MRRSCPQLLNILLDDAMTARKELSYNFQHENSGSYFLHIDNVQQHAIALLKLNQQVKELLPSQLQPWCRTANYRRNILVLEIANANWMMALRYEQSNLLSALRKKILPSLASIDIRINPGLMARGDEIVRESAKFAASTEKSVSLRRLSIKSAEELKRLAKCCPKKLRVALERLAALAKN